MTGGGRISVDTARCIGAGQCVMHAPDAFDQDLDGVVVSRVASAGPDIWADVVEAAQRCPVGAIRLGADGQEENRAG